MENNHKKSINRILKLKSRTVFSSAVLFFHLGLLSTAYAAPQGGVVVGGSGSINQSGLNTTINQSSQNMAIDWQSYNVQQNERVQYIQPNSRSISLNRILGNNASTIRGRIDANGQVILVNPNGIFFSATSTINVGGLMASGLYIKPSDFMNGNYIFNEVAGTDGFVINSGIINAATGGNVTLLGKQVRNDGMIVAKLGAVNMAAGKAAVVTFDNAGLLGVRITKEVLQNELGIDPAILNSGSINAEGGRILLTASVSQDIFSSAVNTGGMEQATSAVVNADGSFTLGGGADVVNTGTLDVSTNTANQNAGDIVVIGDNVTSSGVIKADSENGNGGNIELHAAGTTLLTENSVTSAQVNTSGVGGNIKVLGNNVGLFDNAQVNASGANGGGEVLIGGDKTGQNKQIRNAEFIYLSENSSIKADATDNGNGGKLITFAADTARIYGSLSARGGVNGGNGGFIETSGLRGFEILNAPDMSAPKGKGGMWLIDPYNLDIVADGSGTSDISTNRPSLNVFRNNGGTATSTDGTALAPARIEVGLLTDALSNGNVTLQTGDGGADAGDINFRTDLVYSNDNDRTLTLRAHNDILTNGNSINASGGEGWLALDFQANADGVGGGSVNINNSQIRTNGGNFTASGVSFTLTESVLGNTLQTNGGNVNLSMTGAVNINGAINTNGGNFNVVRSSSFTSNTAGVINTGTSSGGDIDISSDGAVQIGGALTTNNGSLVVNSASFTNTAVITTTDNSGADSSGTVNITTTGTAAIASDININANITTRNASVTLNENQGAFATAGAINIASAATITTLNNNVNANGARFNAAAGSTISTGTGRVDLDGISGDVTLANINAGSLDARNVGTVTQTVGDSVVVSATTRINAGGNSVTLANAANNFGRLDLTATTANINDTNALQLGNTIIAGSTLDITVGGTLNQVGGTSVRAANAITTLTATGNTINLANNNNNFNQVNITAGNATVTDTDSIVLGSSTITGSTLNITARNNGDITQFTGAMLSATTAITTLTANGNTINMANTGNDFNAITVNAGTATIVDTNALTIAGATTNLTATANSLDLGNITTTDLTLTANAGAIRQQSGSINASGLTTFSAAGNAVTAANASNNFAQVNTTAATLNIADANSLVLGDTILNGVGTTLTVNTNGALTQTGTGIRSDANTYINTRNGSITLNNTGNTFGGSVSLNNTGAGNIVIRDSNSLDIAASNLGSGSFAANAIGITQSGAITQEAGAGQTTFNAGTGVINLNNAGNNFTGAVSLNNSGSGAVAVHDIDSIQFGVSNIGTGTFTVNAVGITQSGVITQAAGAGAVSLNADDGVITLANSDNNFTGTVSVNNTGNNAITITDTNSIDFATSNIGSGAFTVNAVGITQTGGAIVQQAGAGQATFDAGAGVMNLNNTGNNFTGEVSLTNSGTNNVVISDIDNITLAASTVGQELTVTAGAGSDIFQNTADTGLNVGGSATFNVDGGRSIILGNTSNQFNGLSFVAKPNTGTTLQNVTIANATGLDLQTLNLTGDLSVTAEGNILNTTGGMVVAGLTTLDAGTGNIILATGANDFNNVTVVNGGSLTISDVNGLNFAGLNLSGDLTVSANGNITQSAALTNTTTATFDAGNGNITLNNTDNDFNIINISTTNTASITDTTGIQLGSVNASSGLAINTDGDITEAAGSRVTSNGLTTLTSSGAIQLGNGPHDFNALVFNGSNVAINDVSGINIGSGNATSAATGTLSITANGNITDNNSGSVTVANAASLTADNGNITLLNTDFQNTLTVTSANSVTVNDATGLSLGNISAANAIDLTAGDSINGGNLSAASTISLTAGTNITGGDLTAAQVNLTAATGIDASTQTSTLNANNTAGAITINNTGDLTIESLKTVGNITLTNDTNIRMVAGSVDADYDTGIIDMTTTTGSFLGVGAPDDNNPDITGFSGTFIGRLGTFGSVVRPLVIRLKDEILINTRQSISPRYVPQPPRIVNDLSDIKFDFIDASNAVIGEQLISLEELEDIDPAIFSDVRNYTYGQIAIRLPRDQLFEDELQELELKEGEGK